MMVNMCMLVLTEETYILHKLQQIKFIIKYFDIYMSQFIWNKTSNPLKLFSNTQSNFLKYILGNWVSVACDLSGQNLCVVNSYLPLNNIFLSGDYGNSWSNLTTSLGNINLSQVVMATNTQTICLSAIRHALYVSNNYDPSWNEYLTDSFIYNSISCNNMGDIILAVASNPHQLTISLNNGVTFTQIEGIPSYMWSSVTMNSSGIIMAACSSDGQCYISTNSGSDWFQSSLPTTEIWNSISIDGLGNTIVICSLTGSIYISTDTGISWTSCSPDNLNWNNIIISSNSNIIFSTATNSNSIYYSTNNGINWVTTMPDENYTNWGSICCNNDGSIVYACINGGYIYIGTN